MTTGRDAVLACFRAHEQPVLTTADVRLWVAENFTKKWEDIVTTCRDLKVNAENSPYRLEERFLESSIRGEYRITADLTPALKRAVFADFGDFQSAWSYIKKWAGQEVCRLVPTLTSKSSVEILDVAADAIRARTPGGSDRRLTQREFETEWQNLRDSGVTDSAGNRASLGLWAAYFSDLVPGTNRGEPGVPLVWQGFGKRAAEDAAAGAAVEAAEEEAARRRGQGFVASPERRKAIELHAMAAAKTYLEGRDFEWEDTSKSKPYDLVGRKESEEVFVEVKGTTAGGDQVFLTRGEVEHAQDPSHKCVLFILYDIKVEEETPGKPIASGGKRRVIPSWVPAGDGLVVVTYQYAVPAGS